MAKVKSMGGNTWFFKCLGCETNHAFSDKAHEFDGNLDCPTISPSVLCTGYAHSKDPAFPYGKPIKCHSFVKNGMIQYLSDCEHPLAGQTIELPEIGLLEGYINF